MLPSVVARMWPFYLSTAALREHYLYLSTALREHYPKLAGAVEFWVDPESPYHKDIFSEDKTFVLYCASSWRSTLAAKTLAEMGLKSVVHFKGGFKKWKIDKGVG